MKTLWKCALAFAFAAAAGAAHAQAFPERPVRIIFPFPAGAVSDYLIRLVAQHATEELGKPVIVENRSGGAGIPGTDAGAKATPDGYSVLFVANSFASNPVLRKDLPYNTATDFAPVALLGATPLVLTAHPSVPVKTTQDLVALAKKQPGSSPTAPRWARHRTLRWPGSAPSRASTSCSSPTAARARCRPTSWQGRSRWCSATSTTCCRTRRPAS
jgi:tripartite-type tricarboxylate transporter receptor subunit TctC